MIKPNKYNHNGKYHSEIGTYFPFNREKFLGSENPIFKSGLEKRMMMYLDKNPLILCWNYEPFSIKYFDKSTNKVRRYYIDFVAQVQMKDKKQIIWIEVKSKKETKPPKNKKNIKDQMLWLKNTSKWSTAESLAKAKGYKFKIITEEQLN